MIERERIQELNNIITSRMKGVAILKSAFSELNDYVNFLSIFIIKLTVNNKNILLC